MLLAPLQVAGRYVAVALFVRLEQSPGQVNQGAEIRYRPGGPPRIDAAQEQHLGLVDIPDPGQVFLVEQRLADRAVRLGAQSPHRFVAVPVGAQQIRAQVAGDPRLLAGADQPDDAELVPDRLPVLVGEHQPDPVIVPYPLGRGPHPPGAVHAQVGVDGQPVTGPGEQVLAAGCGLGDHVAGQVHGGQPRDTEVAAGQRPSRQCLMQAASRLPDHVSFGHEPSVLDPVKARSLTAGSRPGDRELDADRHSGGPRPGPAGEPDTRCRHAG